MDGATAELLQLQPAFDFIGESPRQLDPAAAIEKVRSMQEMHVQRMALDPFAAVQQTPQPVDLRSDLNVHRIFNRLDGGHLISDRTYPADSGRDVGDFIERAPS